MNGNRLQTAWAIADGHRAAYDAVFAPAGFPLPVPLDGPRTSADLMARLDPATGSVCWRTATVPPRAEGSPRIVARSSVCRASRCRANPGRRPVARVPDQHVAVKAEYLRNGEYGRVPSIRNDVLVASLVLSY